MKRREYLKAVATGAVVGLAGCTETVEFIAGEGPLELESGKVWVAEDVLAETEYEELESETHTFEENIEIDELDEEREVHLANWQSIYGKAAAETDEHHTKFITFASPKIPLDQLVNPVSQMDTDEIVEYLFEGEQDEFDAPEEVGETQVDLLDETVEATEYETETEVEVEGHTQEITMRAIFAHAETEDDHAFALTTYPEEMADEERDDAKAMFEGVEHDPSDED